MKEQCSFCGGVDPDDEYNDNGECQHCVAVRRWGELDTQKVDLLMEAREKHGDIRPLPGKEAFDDTHFTRDQYNGRTWIAVWFQLPDTESTGIHRREIV